MPTERSVPRRLKNPLTPTTAFSFSSASVVCRVVEVDLALLERVHERLGQSFDVHLEADGERRLRADAGAHAAVLLALDRLVELKLSAPVVLVTEGVEAEYLLALREQALLMS